MKIVYTMNVQGTLTVPWTRIRVIIIVITTLVLTAYGHFVPVAVGSLSR